MTPADAIRAYTAAVARARATYYAEQHPKPPTNAAEHARAYRQRKRARLAREEES